MRGEGYGDTFWHNFDHATINIQSELYCFCSKADMLKGGYPTRALCTNDAINMFKFVSGGMSILP